MRATVRGQLRKAFEVGVETEEQIEVFRREAEIRGHDLRAATAMPVHVGVREISRIMERVAHFKLGQRLILAKMLVVGMLPELDRIEFERAERRLDEIQPSVT